MSPDEEKNGQNEGREQRVRVDAGKVDVARLRLAAIDRTVFAGAQRHTSDDHDRLLREAVDGLFAHG